MVSNYKKPPVFSRDCTWKEGDLKSIKKAKFAGHHGAKEVVYTCGVEKGMEFLVSKTLQDYLSVALRLNWNWHETFNQFSRVLEGSPRTAWEEVMNNPALAGLYNRQRIRGPRLTISCLVLSSLMDTTQ